MFFRNIHFYKFEDEFKISTDELSNKLKERLARPCGQMELTCSGWASPCGYNNPILVRAMNGCMMINMMKKEKILPASVVKNKLRDIMLSFEGENGRPMGRKEKFEAKEKIINTLLPTALVRESNVYAYIDTISGYLFVNTSTAKKAEELIELLRKTIGNLPVILPSTEKNPIEVMTEWLVSDNLPQHFSIGDSCVLKTKGEKAGTIRCKDVDISSEQIKAHLTNGAFVSALDIEWDDRIRFTLCDDLSIKKIKFILIEEDDKEGDEVSAFDADFAVMQDENRDLISGLITVLN